MAKSSPFDTIESALEFIVLLEQAVTETSADLEDKLRSSNTSRSAEGLRLALYKVDQLFLHVQKSRRILNDLTKIRRVLLASDVLTAGPRRSD